MNPTRPAPTIDRPPLWTALDFSALRRADAQDHLDGLGVLRALGYAHTRASALELLQRAGRGARGRRVRGRTRGRLQLGDAALAALALHALATDLPRRLPDLLDRGDERRDHEEDDFPGEVFH